MGKPGIPSATAKKASVPAAPNGLAAACTSLALVLGLREETLQPASQDVGQCTNGNVQTSTSTPVSPTAQPEVKEVTQDADGHRDSMVIF